jgi:hypothetical protein
MEDFVTILWLRIPEKFCWVSRKICQSESWDFTWNLLHFDSQVIERVVPVARSSWRWNFGCGMTV